MLVCIKITDATLAFSKCMILILTKKKKEEGVIYSGYFFLVCKKVNWCKELK